MPTNKKKAHDDDEMRDDPNRDMDMDEEIEPGMQKRTQSQETGTPPAGTKRSEGGPGRPSSTPRKRK